MTDLEYALWKGTANDLRKHFNKDNVNILVGGAMPLAIAALSVLPCAEKVELLISLGANPGHLVNGSGGKTIREEFDEFYFKNCGEVTTGSSTDVIRRLLNPNFESTFENTSDLLSYGDSQRGP